MPKRPINHRWRYPNLTLVAIGILAAIYLSRIESFHQFLLHLGNFGYLGAFIAGMLFVSTFTVATGLLILLTLAETLPPLGLALIAGWGAVIGDLTIFHIVKDNLQKELTDIYRHQLNGRHLSRLLHTKYFSWTFPVIGAIIIASPLPDELGISLMGISKMKPIIFAVISFLLNSIGIFLIVAASSLFRL